MPERYFQHTFAQGMTLLGERMPGTASAAMTLLIPSGSAADPGRQRGSASVLADLVLRGAGQRDSKQLTDYLDRLGLQRSSSVGVYHARFSAAALADRVVECFSTYADIVRRPHLPDSGFQAARDLALQGLAGLEDDPRQKLLIELREWHLPRPLGRNSMGVKSDLQKLTLEDCRRNFQRGYHAHGSILAIAGAIDWPKVKDEVEKYFGDFDGQPPPKFHLRPPPGNFHHEAQKSEQTHIGVAYPSIQETDPDYYVMRAAIEVLSGGMSGRLFTEVREKRALCYNVWAGYTSLKGRGSILCYSGTSNDRAQSTLDCLIGELHRLSDGVTPAELQRAKTGLKASTIMQGESTSARAGAIAHDFFMRGRIRPLEEITAAIDAVTVESVNEFLKTHRPGSFTVVIVGPKELKLP